MASVAKLSPTGSSRRPLIAQHRPAISAICRRYRIARQEVFGSAARAMDFTPASDADFLVEFAARYAMREPG